MTLKNISFRNLKFKEYSKFKNYYKTNLDKKNVFVKNKKIFDYHFKNKKIYNFFITIKKKKIISIQGYIPQSKYDYKLPNNQVFLSNFHALQNQVPGIGRIAFIRLIKKKIFVGSINFPKRMLKYHENLGFNTGKMKHYFFISPFIKNFQIIKFKKGKKLNQQKSINLSNISLKKIRYAREIKLTKKNFINYMPTKSINFIKNRYLKYPYFKYQCYEVYKNEKAIAVIIFKKINFKNQNILKIIDFFGEQKNFKELKNVFLYLLKKNKSESIDFYNFGIEDKYIKKAGFKDREKYKEIIIPEWFNPFQKKNIDYYYAFKNKTNKSIRLFKGDGDRDRPN